MSVGTSWYLTLAAILFTIGAIGLLVRGTCSSCSCASS